MVLTDDQVNEFIEITKRVFHRTLSPEEARTIATRFLVCLDLLAHQRARSEGSNLPLLSPPRVEDIRKPKEPEK